MAAVLKVMALIQVPEPFPPLITEASQMLKPAWSETIQFVTSLLSEGRYQKGFVFSLVWKTFLLGCQCVSLLFSHLNISSKGLFSGAPDGFYQMSTESGTLGYSFILNRDIKLC